MFSEFSTSLSCAASQPLPPMVTYTPAATSLVTLFGSDNCHLRYVTSSLFFSITFLFWFFYLFYLPSSNDWYFQQLLLNLVFNLYLLLYLLFLVFFFCLYVLFLSIYICCLFSIFIYIYCFASIYIYLVHNGFCHLLLCHLAYICGGFLAFLHALPSANKIFKHRKSIIDQPNYNIFSLSKACMNFWNITIVLCL